MKAEQLWLLGKLAKSYGDELRKRGYKVNLISDGPKKYKSIMPDNNVIADFSSKESLIRSLKKQSIKVDGVLTQGFENYVLPSAWLAEYYNVPGLSEEAALVATDKTLMRQKFIEYDATITPEFTELFEWETAEKFAQTHQFPLILKPAHLAKSLLVTKNSNLIELRENYNHAQKILTEIYRKYAVKGRQPKMLVEEYLDGSAHSIDAVIDQKQRIQLLEIVDYVVGYEIGIKDNFHFARLLPSRLTPDMQNKVKTVAEKGIKALDLRSSPAHIEIIITKDGPKIIEIGARAGGYRVRMYQEANGIDYFTAIFDTAIGKSSKLVKTKNNFCAVLEVFPKKDGILKVIKGLDRLKENSATVYVRKINQIGDQVGLAKNGYKAVLIVMLVSNNKQKFFDCYNYVKDQLEIVTT